jgi:hypothetical protein
VAIPKKYLGKGLAKMIIHYVEEFAPRYMTYSIKADTNFDNIAMIKIFERWTYAACIFKRKPQKSIRESIG